MDLSSKTKISHEKKLDRKENDTKNGE